MVKSLLVIRILVHRLLFCGGDTSSCRPQPTFRPLLKLFRPPCVLDSVVLSVLEVILYFSFLVWVIICACYLFLTRTSAWIILLHLTFILLPTFYFWFFGVFLHPQTPTCIGCLFLSWSGSRSFSVLKLHTFWFSSPFWSKGVEVQRLAWDYGINSHDYRIN